MFRWHIGVVLKEKYANAPKKLGILNNTSKTLLINFLIMLFTSIALHTKNVWQYVPATLHRCMPVFRVAIVFGDSFLGASWPR